MKFLFSILVLAATVTVQAQVTNLVKISALPTVSSIAGTETVPLVQSGTTKTATVAQLISGATAQCNAASNYFQAYDTAATATMTANATTAASATTAAAAAAAAALVATNSSIQSAISAASNVNATAINTLSATVTANNSAQTAALIATNGQIQNAMAALSVGVGGGIQNGGNGTLSTGTITNLVQPTIYYSVTAPGAGSYISNINCNASFQKLSIAEKFAGSQWLFSPQNFVDGQTLTVIIQNTVATASFGTVAAVTNAANAIFQVHGISGTAFTPVGTSGSVLSTVTSRNGTAYLNWQFVGGVVIFSGTPNL